MVHEIVLTIFIMIAAAALVLQGCAMYGLYKVVERMHLEVSSLRVELTSHIDPLADSLAEIVTTSRDPLRSFINDLAEVAHVLRESSGSVDEVLDDLLDRFRLQVIRVDHTITDVLEKVDKTTATVQRNIIGPVSEASAVLKGIQAGLDFFLSRRRESRPSDVPQDEQMFI
jgi:ABC-type transporter Mla subunit MlaD